MNTIRGKIVDIQGREIYNAEITVSNGKISNIKALETGEGSGFIIPGFVDAHVHIESSMLVPQEFARLAVVHGTVATVSDPHEIANVCGSAGVDYMIEAGKQVPFKFNFGAPSCVPATVFETAGDALDSKAVDALLARPEVRYLSEMMNFPGVLQGDEEVMKKIASAKKYGKPVDGHAPGLRGEQAKAYIDAGISTDHECFTSEEALDKLAHGMKILVREGSAARNFNALVDLLKDHAQHMMFCSDDKHPDSLEEGHINQLCARAVAKGVDVFDVLLAACINPVLHYKLDVGLLREGDPADFIIVEDLEAFQVKAVYINGQLVAENGKSLIKRVAGIEAVNRFDCQLKKPEEMALQVNGKTEGNITVDVIEALDGELITKKLSADLRIIEGSVQTDLENDILKIVVVNRYMDAPVAKAFIKNFGFSRGAIASSVAHDSHNIVAVGADDASISRAVNLVIEARGGVSLVDGDKEMLLALPVAGLMSTDDGYDVARQYKAIDEAAKELGSSLSAPFMTLSFMALLVIPHLKLSDKGLFDGDRFELVS